MNADDFYQHFVVLFCFVCWSVLFNDSRQLIDKC